MNIIEANLFDDLQSVWAAVVFVGASIAAFFAWVRSLLHNRPSFAEFRARGISFWRAVWAKLAFIKTKIVAGLLMIGSAIVTAYDFLMPVITGTDWSPLTAKIPQWVQPLIWFGIGALFLWLRHITAKETNQVVAAVQAGNTPREAVMMVAAREAPELTHDQKVT